MTYLSLIVKGNKFQAARAAADRGIPFAFVRETAWGETVGKANYMAEPQVAAWFNECEHARLGETDNGFLLGPRTCSAPVGSLLFWERR